ncbi:ribosomal protein L22 [Xylariaceae sp. FL0804]|nr:ribosomal protein L22 [Xylariaceae sp. FL0804]
MSLRLPARLVSLHAPTTRLGAAAGKPSLHLQYLQPRTQRRNAWYDRFKWGSKKTPSPGSVIDKELTRREREEKLAAHISDRTSGASIFEEEIKEAGERDPGSAKPGNEYRHSSAREHTQRALDPDPRWRIRWQKKKVMQMVRANGRLTKEERIKQSEKDVTSSSEGLPTSSKKLVHLARQIVGKTVDDAIVQMRYSKKKMAREVKWQLEEARDLAVSGHGMGLGAASGEAQSAAPRQIQTKDGRWIEVQDPTRLYVDQSWVTKGPIRGVRVNYHGRGKRSLMKSPTAAINLVLKEEKTRMRLYDEKVEKEARKAPWVHLPNRPITAQRPYYSW